MDSLQSEQDKLNFNLKNNQKSFPSLLRSATLAVLPLSIAVIPWGMLCGTLSIEAGLSVFQSQLMSLIVFAGAAQLAGITILGTGGGWVTLLNTTTMISIRHVLYSATYKEHIAPLPLWKRTLFAFLLTDEMFAVARVEEIKTGQFNYWYAIVSGAIFYLVWQISTFIGIYSANFFKNIDELGFDFAIVATFIAMVVPMVKNEIKKSNPKDLLDVLGNPVLIAVIVSAFMSFVFESLYFSQGLIFSTLIGMFAGVFVSKLRGLADRKLL